MIDQAQLLNRLIDTLSTAADELAKLDAYVPYWKEDSHTFLRRQDKVAAEALLLAYLAARVPDPDNRLSTAVELLCAGAESHIATARNQALLRRFPQTATTLGVGFVLLIQLGRSLPSIERLLRRAVTHGFASLNERGTFRLMDMRWTFGLLDPSLVRPVEELLPFSTLAASPHPLYTANEDEYAITHALYYLTDFGCRTRLPELPSDIEQMIDPFLAWNAVHQDLDLLGEFLIAAMVLHTPMSPAFKFAWHLFTMAWEDAGGLVGPEYSPARLAQLAQEEAGATEFLENYHTRFVGGILCAVALTVPQHATERHESQSTSYFDLAERCFDAVAHVYSGEGTTASNSKLSIPHPDMLLEWIVARLITVLQTTHEPPPLWLRTAMECCLPREELSKVLYDALLIATGRRYRLLLLAEVLAVGAAHTSLRSATFARALDFLLVQQLDNGFIGVHQLLVTEQASMPAKEAQLELADLLTHIATALTNSPRD
jgi:hypothetical protein